jgi:hypothetical protein
LDDYEVEGTEQNINANGAYRSSVDEWAWSWECVFGYGLDTKQSA